MLRRTGIAPPPAPVRPATLKPRRCKLDAARLREVLEYDEKTGVFRARISTANRAAGEIAGCLKQNGYIEISVDGRGYYGHRLAWLYVYGAWPTALVDHRDGDTTNNAIGNLRPATKSVNAQNLKGAHRGNKTGLLGVVAGRDGGGFAASICVAGKRHWLGVFRTAEEAHQAYLNKKRVLHEGCTI